VASGGNCGCLDATAENPYILSVAGTDQNDARWTSSSQGNHIDLSAPSVGIVTTNRGGAYVTVQGTSFAAPIVAGVLGLMHSANPQLSPTDLKNLLLANTDDKGGAGWDNTFGFGRVNAYRAVAAAKASVAPPDTTGPTVAIGSPAGGTSISGSVTVAVTASDNTSVAAVDLYLNGNYHASDTAAPYSFFVDTTALGNGGASIQARATDPAGNTGQSSVVSLTVANLADTIAPVVSITGLSITGKGNTQQASVSVSATDNMGITKVELFVDGQLRSAKTAPPFSFALSLRQYSNGSHAVQAKGYDAKGNVGTSAQTSFTKQ
jgi:thermitase